MDKLLSNRLSKFRANVSSIDQRIEYESNTVARHTSRIKVLEEEKAWLVKAIGTIDRCIQVVSANGIGKIEGMVTDGLRRVFENDSLGLVIEKKETARGNSYRILVKKGDTVGNPMESFGGAIQNVVAFLLRVILIKRFKLASFLSLDEQFSNVAPCYQPRIAQLLKTLAGLGFTIFAISHQPTITGGADSVYELKTICVECGYDVTPQQNEPVLKVCPKCQSKRNTIPTLIKVEKNDERTQSMEMGTAGR